MVCNLMPLKLYTAQQTPLPLILFKRFQFLVCGVFVCVYVCGSTISNSSHYESSLLGHYFNYFLSLLNKNRPTEANGNEGWHTLTQAHTVCHTQTHTQILDMGLPLFYYLANYMPLPKCIRKYSLGL